MPPTMWDLQPLGQQWFRNLTGALATWIFCSFCWNSLYSLGWYSTTKVTTVPAPFRHAAASSWVISSMF